MIIRTFGVLVGALFILFAVFTVYRSTTFPIASVFNAAMGIAFLMYGIGGQKMLRKFFPEWASEEDEKDS